MGRAARRATERKKKLVWHTRYGAITVQEQRYRVGRNGVEVRPFAVAAGVQCRGYSLPFQRVLVDFGAEASFGRAAERVREHYGIEVPTSAVRRATESHGARLQQQQEGERVSALGPEPGVAQELPDHFAQGGEQATQEREAQRDLDRAIAGLTPRYREVIALFHIQHKSYAEISSALGVPMGTVMTWLHRARKQLVASLKEHLS